MAQTASEGGLIMKMYKFTLNNCREKLKIRMDVCDVEEKPKTYKIVNGYGNVYESMKEKKS